MTDNYNVGVRVEGKTHFLHREYPFDAPVNGGGFFDNVARALSNVTDPVAETFENLGYGENNDDGSFCWSSNGLHDNDHKIPVWDVTLDRVFVTEDGTPATLVTSFTRQEFVDRYKK